MGLKQHYEKEENLDDGLYEYGYVRIGVLVVLFQVQAPAWLDMGSMPYDQGSGIFGRLAEL